MRLRAPALMTVLSAWLQAGITVTPAAATLAPGGTLVLEVHGTGSQLPEAVAWSAWGFRPSGRACGSLDPALAPPAPVGLGKGRYRFTAPAHPGVGAYLLAARCGDAVSGPVTLQVGTCPEWAPESPVPAPERTFPFQQLPEDLQDHVVSMLPMAFRGVSRRLDEASRAGAGQLVFHDLELTDLDLMRLMLGHPSARSVAFGICPRLTQPGLLAALNLRTDLVALETGETVLPRTLASLAATHPQLTRLSLRTRIRDSVPNECVQLFWDRLTHLELFTGERTTDAAVSGAARLETLVLQGTGCAGERLPASLRALVVRRSRRFTGRDLPSGLEFLELENGHRIPAGPLPAGLRILDISGCCAMAAGAFADLIHGCPALEVLRYEGVLLDTLVAALPGTLTDLDLQGPGLTAPSFSHLVNLERLAISDCPPSGGRTLPAGLRRLEVDTSRGFLPEDFSPAVRAGLVSLHLVGCPSWRPGRLAEHLALLPGLRDFSFRHAAPMALDPAPLGAAHPSLERVLLEGGAGVEGQDDVHPRSWSRGSE